MKSINFLSIASSLGANIKGSELTPYAFNLIGLRDFLTSIAPVNNLGIIEAPYIQNTIIEHNVRNLKEIMELSEKIASNKIDKDGFTLIVGGDQSISIGTTKLLLNTYKNLGILLLDAHPDCNTEKTTPTSNMHGMCVAFILRKALPDISNPFFNELPKPKIFILGLRTFDKDELENVAGEKIKVLDFKKSISMDLNKLINEIKEFFIDVENVHISFSANVMTPSVAPGVNTPIKDGYVPEYIEEIFKQLVLHKLHIVSVEISEINLLKDKEGQTLHYSFNIIKKLLQEIFNHKES